MAYAFVGVGFLLLIIGGEIVLRGGVGLSRSLGLSPLLIGLIVVSAGTSSPELVVSLLAATHHAPDIAVGNVVGSNIANILLILGLGALIRPISASPKIVWRDGMFLLLASVAFAVIAACGTLTREAGYAMLAGFVIFLLLSFFTDWRRPVNLSVSECRAMTRIGNREASAGRSIFLLLIGVIALYFGGRCILSGSVVVARQFLVPEAVIGLTLVALGTSLPELATTVIAAARGQTGLAIGNLIGSSIFNILFVLGTTAIVHPIPISPMLAHADVYVMVAASAALVAMLTMGWRLSRLQGFLLIVGYLAYAVFVAWRQGFIPAHLAGIF